MEYTNTYRMILKFQLKKKKEKNREEQNMNELREKS
jgi:hypothetical protein